MERISNKNKPLKSARRIRKGFHRTYDKVGFLYHVGRKVRREGKRLLRDEDTWDDIVVVSVHRAIYDYYW